MEWILRSPQMQTSFGNLAYVNTDGYQINDKCNDSLKIILHSLLTEDKNLRSYRRSISFGQNIQKDIVPLLLHTQDDKTVELLIQILVNLTIPIECLISLDVTAKTAFGRHMIFEITNLLNSAKQAFIEQKLTKVLLEFLKKNSDFEQPDVNMKPEQITNTANGLLLLRNILHIPEENKTSSPTNTIQNQIIWNIFSQSIDKVLIKLMTITEAINWSVTMVQVIALLYKDQHVGSLHKLLNSWLEASFSESSEDNESNTTLSNRDSDHISTTSDSSSDNCGTGSGHDSPNPYATNWQSTGDPSGTQLLPPPPPPRPLAKRDKTHAKHPQTALISNAAKRKHDDIRRSSFPEDRTQHQFNSEGKGTVTSSDCGYGTLVDKQESGSTSSNEETQKPVHQKPHNPKQKPNTKVRLGLSMTYQDKQRKKIVKRAKTNITNVRGLSRKTPNDADITMILKEFTIDFLLKGYNYLVRTFHSEMLNNIQIEIDTSHFFWMVMYFLKFATQIDLDLQHISSVLSNDMVAYLTAEGVKLCEQFELATKLDGEDLKPSIKRLNLVVNAIREIIQAIEVYKKKKQFSNENRETLLALQVKMCEMNELRLLMVLLLRRYDPKYHSKPYLQDLIVTNHILLVFVDDALKLPEYKGNKDVMKNHIKQFATHKMMYQYGLLLESYAENGEFVNECVLNVMHHVGGLDGGVVALCQPSIVKIFISMAKSEFEISDVWTDIIEFVKNTFVRKSQQLRTATAHRRERKRFDNATEFIKPSTAPRSHKQRSDALKGKKPSESFNYENWTEDERASLAWNHIKCNTSSDVVGDIVKIYTDEGAIKSRGGVINELFKQNIINVKDFDRMLQNEINKTARTTQQNTKTRHVGIAKLCDQLINDGKCNILEWIQQVLLDTCHAKIYLEKKSAEYRNETQTSNGTNILSFRLFKKKHVDLPLISPVAYYNLLADKCVPLVQWNFEHVAVCKDIKFLQLFHKLGFLMPVDTGKVFIGIPHFWTADYLYDVAGKVLPIDTSKLIFSKNDIPKSCSKESLHNHNFMLPADCVKKDMARITESENFYQIQKQSNLASMINYTPKPGNSYQYEKEARSVGNVANQSWLEIVQRSQELKITLNVKSDVGSMQTHNMTSTVVQTSVTVTEIKLPTPLPLAATTAGTDPTTLICEDDDDDNISACDTASVESDLTRMYVSDEDEKSPPRRRLSRKSLKCARAPRPSPACPRPLRPSTQTTKH